MYHSIIHNKDDIIQFSKIFGGFGKNQVICLYLTMRRKYCQQLSQGTTIINRLIIPGGDTFEQKLYQNILRLETPIGSYTDHDFIVPNEALALYCIVEPKDPLCAMAQTIAECVEASAKGELLNSHVIYRDRIPKTNSLIKYKQIDLDTKDHDSVAMVHKLLTDNKIPVIITIETKNGFHIVYPEKVPKEIGRILYEFKQTTKFSKLDINGKAITDYWFSITNQPNIIMPGTYQGGFPARIISLEDWLVSN